MVKIAPSILSADFCMLDHDLHSIQSADWIHVDVMDGMFVPNITVGIPVIRSLRAHTSMFMDVHLMIEDPARYVKDFSDAGADLLSVHLESASPPAIHKAIDLMESCGVKKSIALRPITKAGAVMPYIENLDMILIMTVEPGFSGQAFMPEQLKTIEQTRRLIDRYNPNCLLEVDGGISPQTAPQVINAGANVLVSGSSIFSSSNIPETIAALRGN